MFYGFKAQIKLGRMAIPRWRDEGTLANTGDGITTYWAKERERI